ncbi:hypothetical protein DEU56DRAFT_940342 [Suillus clintonianus]|uniref:uncharacterized protein n=1 Tax=Suillus clintonianus TaxID=1904413 RepID=UPI001B85C196|nr:uncharacterized protein DEU56DRAFT_940342 [Suillus clintonianus]KAG2141882.1 hypothetical protein DEU56DRAFT_940342 [Suillus clintonianus]
MDTVKSQVDFSTASDIISALQNILAHSQMIMPDLETSYSQSRLPTTNYFAIELKDQSIGDIITERQHQLDAILPEISSLETVIDGVQNIHRQLVEQKAKIIESIHLHNRLRSALWRLPTEILSHIFYLCLPDVPRLSMLQPPSPLTAPMLLTGICQQWREVAVGVPGLWRMLSVTVNDHHWQRAVFCYDIFLKRSQGLPLSLALQCSKNHSTKLQSLLHPYVKQILSLSINCPQVQGLDQPELLLKDLPALQELTIGHNNEAFPRLMSRLPSTVRCLSFPGTWFGPMLPSYLTSVQWAHLTNIEFCVDGQNTLFRLLRLCPNLSSLTTAMVSPESQTSRPFTHTKLQFLIFRGSVAYKTPLSGVFSTLSLPNLRGFYVCSPSTWPHEEFKTFLTRSKCPLQILSTCHCLGVTAERRAEYAAIVRSSKVS